MVFDLNFFILVGSPRGGPEFFWRYAPSKKDEFSGDTPQGGGGVRERRRGGASGKREWGGGMGEVKKEGGG